MSKHHAESSYPDEPNFHIRVANYLIGHPNFFDHHPEVLAALQVPHLVAGATSLIEQQVRVLRKQLESERNRVSHVIALAREYDAMITRLHTVTLKLIALDSPEELCALAKEFLLREFNADAVTLKLFPLAIAIDQQTDSAAAVFQAFIMHKHAQCGVLDDVQGKLLFDEMSATLRSAALIPIHTDTQFGVLAIASSEIERFHADMATDLLDRLGEIFSNKLKTLPLNACNHL
ncbi:DUF484 family protein [Chromatium okenii]|uniref:DUF484 family protein n=1 Tax=Chromatium okenii TaxID=61644 RepID=UPI0026EE21A7|nr:DUF484 family protein [Chromatium okenii]MBV5308931.1 DUF484 family protein [Chromatium okenii]